MATAVREIVHFYEKLRILENTESTNMYNVLWVYAANPDIMQYELTWCKVSRQWLPLYVVNFEYHEYINPVFITMYCGK